VNSSNYFGVAADNMLTEEQNEIVESAAEMLYGLIHVRYILTSKGLSAMVCLITAVCMLMSFQQSSMDVDRKGETLVLNYAHNRVAQALTYPLMMLCWFAAGKMQEC
jgi:hypothetical protein